nr:BatA domain-containing protein [Sunxiuqinia sp.]
MRFIYPEFLPALLFISIPILIHFLHFKRYKTIYFSQVSFLKAIKEETKKKNNLKQLLILISRIMTIVALVLVFAQPYLPANRQEHKLGRQLIGLYVDNSFSMNSESENGLLLEQAKNKAISIANSYGPGTSFVLMNNQNLPEQQQLLNKTQLISQLGAIRESPGSLSMSNARSLLKNNLEKQELKSGKMIYLISDFQAYRSDFSEMENDTNSHTFLISMGSPFSNNLLIDTCWFETPGHKKNREETLFARI